MNKESNYYLKRTDFTERLAHLYLQKIGIENVRSNMIDKTDVDITLKSGSKLDVQFSNNFSTFGDYRVDFISAFIRVNSNGIKNKSDCERKEDTFFNVFEKFEKIHSCTVLKRGKFFESHDYLDYILVFFYDGFLDLDNAAYDENFTLTDIKSEHMPDHTLILSRNELLNYLSRFPIKLSNVFINRKDRNNIEECHDSAFYPIDLEHLRLNTNETECLISEGLPEENELFTFFQNQTS